MRRTVLSALIVTVASLALAACGSSSKKSTSSSTSTPAASTSTPASSAPAAGTASHTLTIAANPSGQLKFTKSSLTATAGKVTVQFTNNAPLQHNFTVQQGTSGPVLGATPTFSGGTKTLTLTLKAGTYTYFCSVPGHRQAGMQGTLTVK